MRAPTVRALSVTGLTPSLLDVDDVSHAANLIPIGGDPPKEIDPERTSTVRASNVRVTRTWQQPHCEAAGDS